MRRILTEDDPALLRGNQLSQEEIRPGLVLFLNPLIYSRMGAVCSMHDANLINFKTRAHVCLRVNADESDWAPLFSKPGGARYRLAQAGRSGHPTWTQGVFHAYIFHVYKFTPAMVIAAGRLSDYSRPSYRNWIDPVAWELTPETNESISQRCRPLFEAWEWSSSGLISL